MGGGKGWHSAAWEHHTKGVWAHGGRAGRRAGRYAQGTGVQGRAGAVQAAQAYARLRRSGGGGSWPCAMSHGWDSKESRGIKC